MSDRKKSRCQMAALLLAAVCLVGCKPRQETPMQSLQTDPGPTQSVSSLQSAACHLPDGTLNWHLRCQYDERGNLRSVVRHGADGVMDTEYTYVYDDMGNILSVTTQDGLDITTYTYNAAGKRIRTVHGLSRIEYSYDSKGNLQIQDQYNSDILTQSTTYSYDAQNRLHIARNYDSNGVLRSHANYSYNEEGKLLQERVYTKTGIPPAITTYEYDQAGNLTAQSVFDRSGKLDWKMTYTYDGLGNRLTATRYNKHQQMLWWAELVYAGVNVPEDNVAAVYTARKEILGF